MVSLLDGIRAAVSRAHRRWSSHAAATDRPATRRTASPRPWRPRATPTSAIVVRRRQVRPGRRLHQRRVGRPRRSRPPRRAAASWSRRWSPPARRRVVVLINGRPLALPWIAAHVPAVARGLAAGRGGRPRGRRRAVRRRQPGRPAAGLDAAQRRPGAGLLQPQAVGRPLALEAATTPTARRRRSSRSATASATPASRTPTSTLSRAAAGAGRRRRASPASVTNTGDRAGEEVVQLYVRDVVGSVTRPVKELRGFARVALAPGETARVALRARGASARVLRRRDALRRRARHVRRDGRRVERRHPPHRELRDHGRSARGGPRRGVHHSRTDRMSRSASAWSWRRALRRSARGSKSTTAPRRHDHDGVVQGSLTLDRLPHERLELGIVKGIASLTTQHVLAALGPQENRDTLALGAASDGVTDDLTAELHRGALFTRSHPPAMRTGDGAASAAV